MKAVVTITFEPVSDENGNPLGMKPRLEGRWMDGSGPLGALSAPQILAMLRAATDMIVLNVPFEPPSAVVKASPAALKILDAHAGRPN